MRNSVQSKTDVIGEEHIRWAYKLFFDREPENQKVIDVRLGMFRDSVTLRSHFMGSAEFIDKQVSVPKPEDIRFKPLLSIETEIAEDDLQRMMRHTRAKWEKLGIEKPHWSVMTSERFTSDSIANSAGARQEFYKSGKSDAALLFRALERNGIDIDSMRSCLDFGCGLGRVTRWLCNRIEQVFGCDISTPHLESAQAYLDGEGVTNATFLPTQKFADIDALPQIDLLFSLIVLQHNPPPIMSVLLARLLGRLNPKGVGYVQIPVYLDNYTFNAEEYLQKLDTLEEIEMHILPQSKVFSIIAACGCRVLEVATASSTGDLNGLMSYAFLVQKD